MRTMAWQLVAGLTLRRPAFNSRQVLWDSAVGQVAPGHFLLRGIRYSPLSINTPILHTRISVYRRLCVVLADESIVK